MLEPTCGLGNFLSAGLDHFEGVEQAVGLDINADRLQQAENVLRQRKDARKIKLLHADFFTTDWDAVIAELPEPILILGNPPG